MSVWWEVTLYVRGVMRYRRTFEKRMGADIDVDRLKRLAYADSSVTIEPVLA